MSHEKGSVLVVPSPDGAEPVAGLIELSSRGGFRTCRALIKRNLTGGTGYGARGRRFPVPTRRMIVRSATSLVAALVWAMSILGTATAGFPSTASDLPNWTAEQGSSDQSFTATEAVAHAQRFDVISAHIDAYKTYVGAMRTANPDLVLLAYVNAMFVPPIQSNQFYSWWYAKDANGNKVQSRYGNYMMNAASVGWRNYVRDLCVSRVQASGFDGCYLDMLGVAPLLFSYVTSPPINPATGKVWTAADYLRATSALAANVKSGAGSALVVGNGLRSGVDYFDPAAPSGQILNGIDGASAEAFVRGVTQPINTYRSETDWKKDVDLIVNAEARGKAVLTVTKTWVAGTAAQKDSWHQYAMASFLLGTSMKSYFFFSDSESSDPLADHPWWHVDVGQPVAAYAKNAAGVYVRTFTNGKVLVNPSDTTHTVSLGGTYVDLYGNTKTSVTLGPHTGAVLTKA